MIDWKRKAVTHWDHTPCGSIPAEVYGSCYFKEVEMIRYRDNPWLKEVLPFTEYRDKTVLEIGCGQGTDLCQFAMAGAFAVGTDICTRHLSLANQNLRINDLGRRSCTFWSDPDEVCYGEDSHYDLIYSIGVLHHTPDTNQCIAQAYKALKPGGTFIMAVYHKYSAFHLFNILFKAGLYHGELKKYGYRRLLARCTEAGADGDKYCPLVKLYTRAELKIMLADFSKVSIVCRHVNQSIPKYLEPFLGWYLIAKGVK